MPITLHDFTKISVVVSRDVTGSGTCRSSVGCDSGCQPHPGNCGVLREFRRKKLIHFSPLRLSFPSLTFKTLLGKSV
jgi:hypothetical protein